MLEELVKECHLAIILPFEDHGNDMPLLGHDIKVYLVGHKIVIFIFISNLTFAPTL